MNKMNYLLILMISFLGCKTETPTQFSDEALNDTFIALQGEEVAFKDILEKHKGETLVIDIWASWCRDCIKGMPKVKSLQDKYKDATYIFLSLDRGEDAWKRGIKKYDVQGEHYYMQSGWKGPFGTFVDLDWIPRYMVVNGDGTIALYKAIEADDDKIFEVL